MTAQHIINNIEFSRNSLNIHGIIRNSTFSRIADFLASDEVYIDWDLKGKPAFGNVGPKLELKVIAQLQLVCQKCLKPFSSNVEIFQLYSLVDNVENFFDNDSEEDFIEFSSEFIVENLIEEELILAIPHAPVHLENCMTKDAFGSIQFQSPFNKLKGIKF